MRFFIVLLLVLLITPSLVVAQDTNNSYVEDFSLLNAKLDELLLSQASIDSNTLGLLHSKIDALNRKIVEMQIRQTQTSYTSELNLILTQQATIMEKFGELLENIKSNETFVVEQNNELYRAIQEERYKMVTGIVATLLICWGSLGFFKGIGVSGARAKRLITRKKKKKPKPSLLSKIIPKKGGS